MVLRILSFIVTVAMLIIAAMTDYKKRIVPNRLTFSCMVAGLALCFLTFHWREGVFRFGFMILLFFVGRLKIIGLGDMKLLMALAALQGAEVSAFTFVAAAILMIIYCLKTEPTLTKMTFIDTFNFFMHKIKLPHRSEEKYPFAVFIAFGYPIALVLSYII